MHFSVSAALHHPSTASEDQRYEEASQHRSDYCCARGRRSCFGTACGSWPDCEHRHRPGCSSSRRGRSLFSAQKSDRVVCWSTRCGPLMDGPRVGGAGTDWEAVSGLAAITLKSRRRLIPTRGGDAGSPGVASRYCRRALSPSAVAERCRCAGATGPTVMRRDNVDVNQLLHLINTVCRHTQTEQHRT
jgi:hypothetical protein